MSWLEMRRGQLQGHLCSMMKCSRDRRATIFDMDLVVNETTIPTRWSFLSNVNMLSFSSFTFFDEDLADQIVMILS